MVPYGGFWWRVLAYFIDFIVISFASSFLGGILGIGLSLPMYSMGMDDNLIGGAAVLSMIGFNFALNWLYFAMLECSKLQGTLGKLAIGLVVTDMKGERISFPRATGRYFGKYLSAMLFLIGFIMVGLTGRKQGLHDLIAGTLVYRTRNPAELYDHGDVFA